MRNVRCKRCLETPRGTDNSAKHGKMGTENYQDFVIGFFYVTETMAYKIGIAPVPENKLQISRSAGISGSLCGLCGYWRIVINQTENGDIRLT